MAEPAEKSGKAQAATVQNQSGTGPDMLSGATFKRVRFLPTSNHLDTPDVVLSVQGFVVKCQRGVETIVPDFILKAADNATYAKYKIEPGQGRKVADIIRKFPYEIIGEATYAEFKALYNAGTKRTREAVAQYGLKIPLEKVIPQDAV
jgi:hypothetical protein